VSDAAVLTERDEAYAAIAAVQQAWSEDSITEKLDRREIDALADAMVAFRAVALPPEGAPGGAIVTLADLQLPGGAQRALRQAGVRTARQLVARTAGDVLAMPGMDVVTVNQVKEAMSRHGLCFGRDLPGEDITEGWLTEIGFRWHQLDRQPFKQWLLWIGEAADPATCFEDLGIEVAPTCSGDSWHCWARADYSGRYSRFVHLRHIVSREELIFLLEGMVGRGFDRSDVFNGIWMAPGRAARVRGEEQRLDRRIMRERPWRSIEHDETRGRALPEHAQAYEDQKGSGGNHGR